MLLKQSIFAYVCNFTSNYITLQAQGSNIFHTKLVNDFTTTLSVLMIYQPFRARCNRTLPIGANNVLVSVFVRQEMESSLRTRFRTQSPRHFIQGKSLWFQYTTMVGSATAIHPSFVEIKSFRAGHYDRVPSKTQEVSTEGIFLHNYRLYINI